MSTTKVNIYTPKINFQFNNEKFIIFLIFID